MTRSATFGLTYSMECRDFVWTDSESARTLLAAAAGNAALGTTFSWSGPSEEPLSLFLPAQGNLGVAWTAFWMARPLRLVDCLEHRGYPSTLSAAVELEVMDGVFPENSGAIRLEIVEGKAKVTAIPSARAHVDAGAFMGMYTGWLKSDDAIRAGRLRHAGEREVDTLNAAFSGPTPWLMDTF